LVLTLFAYVSGIATIGRGWQGFVMHYFFWQIYFPTGPFSGITQARSLCTEVSFYLFLPLYAAAWFSALGGRRGKL
jgi:peptidoglycan/LPS O-acetylase OafA/YrhL